MLCAGLPVCADSIQLAVPGGTTIEVPAGGVTGLAGPGVTVAVTGITDQRCPSAVDCVWEGMTRVVLKLNDGQATVVLCNLCDDGDRASAAAGYLFTFDRLTPDVALIEALGPAPVLADYTVLLSVSDQATP